MAGGRRPGTGLKPDKSTDDATPTVYLAHGGQGRVRPAQGLRASSPSSHHGPGPSRCCSSRKPVPATSTSGSAGHVCHRPDQVDVLSAGSHDLVLRPINERHNGRHAKGGPGVPGRTARAKGTRRDGGSRPANRRRASAQCTAAARNGLSFILPGCAGLHNGISVRRKGPAHNDHTARTPPLYVKPSAPERKNGVRLTMYRHRRQVRLRQNGYGADPAHRLSAQPHRQPTVKRDREICSTTADPGL